MKEYITKDHIEFDMSPHAIKAIKEVTKKLLEVLLIKVLWLQNYV